MVGIDRLGQEVERPFLHRGDRILDAAVRGHHDDRHLGVHLLPRGGRRSRPLPAGAGRTARAPAAPAGACGPLPAGRAPPARHALPLQRVPEHRAEGVLVLDEKDLGGCGHASASQRIQPAARRRAAPLLRCPRSASCSESISFVSRSSSASAFCRSSPICARCADRRGPRNQPTSALIRLCSASRNVSFRRSVSWASAIRVRQDLLVVLVRLRRPRLLRRCRGLRAGRPRLISGPRGSARSRIRRRAAFGRGRMIFRLQVLVAVDLRGLDALSARRLLPGEIGQARGAPARPRMRIEPAAMAAARESARMPPSPHRRRPLHQKYWSADERLAWESFLVLYFTRRGRLRQSRTTSRHRLNVRQTLADHRRVGRLRRSRQIRLGTPARHPSNPPSAQG